MTVRLDGAQVIGLVELAAPAGDSWATGTALRATAECWRTQELSDLYFDIAWAFPSARGPIRNWSPSSPALLPGCEPRGDQAGEETLPASP
ncbi:MAG: hypothetical protein OEY41_08740 [Acidimicrobiia bacterium]|nr:hypothetical protein [Acidimicrobiia bacterium]MDH5290073.1 hypothetical protein [Acidimicrobiia bacterium]